MKFELPFSEDRIRQIVSEHQTPFHIYDERGIRDTARALNDVFDWVKGANGAKHINHYAVKANPNPHILQILKEEGMGADASSGPEIQLAKAVGLRGERVIFTANNVSPEEYVEAYELGAIMNLDDINQIDVLRGALGGTFPDLISFRHNPGPDRIVRDPEIQNIIGNPKDAKFGVATNQLESAYSKSKKLGAKRFGIHTMLVSNERTIEAHIETARLLLEQIVLLSKKLGITFSYANIGGGLGVAYRPDETQADIQLLGACLKKVHQEIILDAGLPALQINTEYGRYVTAAHGYLVTTVRSIKETHHRYVGVDATMADLMRPGMYDAYHHITVLGKEDQERELQRVVGGLCENNDFFTGSETKERLLPRMEPDDIVIIHTTGAHGHAMGFNYNAKLRPAELLLQKDGSAKEIRRRETRDDYFATLDFPGL